MAVSPTHRARWFGVDPTDGTLIPRNGMMPGRDWGWDVKCSCGWESRTGGGTQTYVRRTLDQHRWDAFIDTHSWNGREWVES